MSSSSANGDDLMQLCALTGCTPELAQQVLQEFKNNMELAVNHLLAMQETNPSSFSVLRERAVPSASAADPPSAAPLAVDASSAEEPTQSWISWTFGMICAPFLFLMRFVLTLVWPSSPIAALRADIAGLRLPKAQLSASTTVVDILRPIRAAQVSAAQSFARLEDWNQVSNLHGVLEEARALILVLVIDQYSSNLRSQLLRTFRAVHGMNCRPWRIYLHAIHPATSQPPDRAIAQAQPLPSPKWIALTPLFDAESLRTPQNIQVRVYSEKSALDHDVTSWMGRVIEQHEDTTTTAVEVLMQQPQSAMYVFHLCQDFNRELIESFSVQVQR